MSMELSGSECIEFLKGKRCNVVDVRSVEDFNRGHLPDAKHLDILASNAAQIIANLPKEESYLVYCTSGFRSRSAIKLMESLAFSSLYHLSDGLLDYEGPLFL
ncbi:MAG: rhodanese-related sulfurtransferase [Bacteroidia bacterium]|jgi:rhodanese-related sulfurtransferase